MRFFALLFLLQISVFSVEPKTKIEVNPPFIGTNETAEIIVTAINEEFIEPPIPSMQSPNFDIAFVNTSVVNRIFSINGQITKEKMFHYVYQLIPKNTGKFIVPAFIGTLRSKKEVYTEPSQIEIKAVDFLQAPSGNSAFGSIFSVFENTPREVFLYWKLSSNQTIQNSGIIADIYVYADVLNFLKQASYIKEVQRVIYNGGVIHEIPLSEDMKTLDSGYFGSKLFYGKLQKRFVLYPLKTGTTLLTPPVFAMEQQFGNFYIQGESVEIHSRAISANPSYIGDKLSAAISLSSNVISSAGEGRLILTLKGSGHTDFFTNPLKNTKIDGLFIAEPSTKLDISIDSNSSEIIMTKTFEYTLIPNTSKTLTIPSFDFSYLKQNQSTHKISTPALSFEGVVQVSTSTSKEQNILAKQAFVDRSYYYASGIWLILGSIVLGVGMMIWSLLKARFISRLNSDEKFARANSANSKMSDFLKESHLALTQNNLKDAARLLRQSILSYCTDKFGLAPSANPDDVLRFLKEKEISFPEKDLMNLLSSLEFHAFAQAPSKEKMITYQKKGAELLNIISKIKY
ncbi:MAG: BatD family protein [Brevinema sp.]